MFFYFIVCSITTIIAYLYTKTRGLQKKVLYMLLVMMPSLFSGLRGVGTDWHLYNDNIDEIIVGTFEMSDYNSLFVQFVRLAGKLGLGFVACTLLTSFLTTVIALKIISMYEGEINFTFAVFSYMIVFYQMSFNIFRQMLAMEILLLGFVYLFKKQQHLKWWVCFIIASLIHSSMLPFGILFFLRELITAKKYIRTRCTIYVAVTCMIFMIPSMVYSMNALLQYIPHYGWYITRFNRSSIGFGILRYFVLAVVPVAILLWQKQYDSLEEIKLDFLPFFSVMGFVLWLTSYISESTIYRISYILLISLPLLHGFVFKKLLLRKRIIGCTCVIGIMFLFWYYDGAVLNTGEAVPYMLFWQ